MINPRDTYVYVVVDTQQIIGATNPSNFVEFSDNRGANPGTGNGFKSEVQRGKFITWCGIVKEASYHSGDSVAINEISMKDPAGKRLLGMKTYREKHDSGVVYGRIRSSGVNNGDIEKYNITILVNGTHSYTIDPQLEMI